MLSVLDIFRIGIGPSSSHTVGPMRISLRFWKRLVQMGHLEETYRIRMIFRGSLAFTGIGHGTPRAGQLGLLGFKPETIDMDAAESALAALRAQSFFIRDGRQIHFDPEADIVLDYEQGADLHPNEMEMQAFGISGAQIYARTYYSTGGGFTASHAQLSKPAKDDKVSVGGGAVPYAFGWSKTRVFLSTAGGIGLLYKQRASISGAEMGCQGEVGVACSMAAGGLAAVWGATPDQIASAAEIGMEHNLGLTCDPVGGLVQIPCIERNAIGAVKAANAARLAMHGTGVGKVSLDQVIETMRQTGLDMSSKYKETSQGGLAVNVIEC